MNIGDIVNTVESCSSTNDLAREVAVEGAEEGTVIVSREQTRGRGTRGKSWYSAKEKGLYASVILRPQRPHISLIPLMAGLAVKDAIAETLGIQVDLRWPNDVLWGDQKIGGILCESGFFGNQLQYVILGIGLNLNHEKEDFPEEIRPQATSLKLITERFIDETLLQRCLWKALNHWYQLFSQGEEDKITTSFERNSVFCRGESVTFVSERGKVEGIYRGINSVGGLVLEEQGRKVSFFAAEVKERERK